MIKEDSWEKWKIFSKKFSFFLLPIQQVRDAVEKKLIFYVVESIYTLQSGDFLRYNFAA